MGFDRLSIKEKQWLLWIHEVTVPGSDFSSIRQSPPGTCLHLHQQLSSQLTNLPSWRSTRDKEEISQTPRPLRINSLRSSMRQLRSAHLQL
ncbi:unnamed protein product [Brassica oleracea var. botrytis]